MGESLVDGGAAGKKCNSSAELIPSGVSCLGKEGNLSCCLPQGSFLASQTNKGDRVERLSDQCANLAFLMAEK